METDFVYKIREILTMWRVSRRQSPKCGSLPRDVGDLVGLLGDMMLKRQFTVEQDSKIADNAGRLDRCRAHHEGAVGRRKFL